MRWGESEEDVFWSGTFVFLSFFLFTTIIFCFFFPLGSASALYSKPTSHRLPSTLLCGVSRWSSALPHSTQEMRKVRRSHTKSRRGCLQCKNGHVKVSQGLSFCIMSLCRVVWDLLRIRSTNNYDRAFREPRAHSPFPCEAIHPWLADHPGPWKCHGNYYYNYDRLTLSAVR